MITENDPMLPRKVDLEKNPSGTELKIASIGNWRNMESM